MNAAPLLLSFEVALAATLLACVFGVGIGAFLTRPTLPARNALDALLTAPMVLPPTVLGYYVLVVLGRRSALGHLYEAVLGTPLVFTRTGAVAAALLGAFPIVAKSARAALESLDPTLTQAARTLGAAPWRAFLTVQLPLASRGILAGTMLAFARSLGDFGVTLMVAGDIPGETQTASLAIYDDLQSGHEGRAGMTSFVLAALALTMLYAVNRLTAPRPSRDAEHHVH